MLSCIILVLLWNDCGFDFQMAVHQLLSTLIQDCWRFLYDLDRRLLIFFSATDLDSDLVAFLICEYELTTGLAVLCVKWPFFFESGVRLD